MNASPIHSKIEPVKQARAALAWSSVGLCLVLVAVYAWVRYAHLNSFGWYEDDLTIVPNAVTLTTPGVFAYVWSYIIHLYGHGRPLSDSLIYIFTHFGWALDGIAGGYWFGLAIQALNLALFFLLLRRLDSLRFALIGTLAYLLYAADTTQVFLTHSLGLHPSITLLLLAFHAYLSKKKVLAYLLVVIILFSYETPFLVFVAAPLLTAEWKPGWWKTFLRHAALLAGALVAVYLLRMSIGEGRVGDLTPWQIVTTPFVHMVEGPLVALGTYFYRPLQALRALNPEIAVTILLGFGLFAALLGTVPGREGWTPLQVRAIFAGLKPAGWLPALRRLSLPESIPAEFRRLMRLAAAGVLMILAAYPLTFTVRAYAISGRDTRVHAAAVVGAALLWACLGTALIQFAGAYRRKLAAVLPLAALFALLAGYGMVIQQDYTQGWQYQRQFWTELLPLVQDAGPGTAILVEPGALQDTRQIGANTWNLPRILNQLYDLPENWADNPPRVFRLSDHWQNSILGADGRLSLDANTTVAPPSLYTTVDPAQVIFIEAQGGVLARRTAPLPLGNQSVDLPAAGQPQLTALPHGFLYSILIEPGQ